MAEPVLECQVCGRALRVLTPEEAREVARRPYDFTVLCGDCQEVVSWEEFPAF